MAQNLKTIELLCFYLIFFTNFLAFFLFFSFKFSPPGYGSMRIQIHSPLLSKAYDIKYPKLLFIIWSLAGCAQVKRQTSDTIPVFCIKPFTSVADPKLFIFGSGSTFVHIFIILYSSSCHMYIATNYNNRSSIRIMSQWRFFFILASSKLTSVQ